MSSSSNTAETRKGKAPANPPPPLAAEKKTTKSTSPDTKSDLSAAENKTTTTKVAKKNKNNNKDGRMTQEQIDSLIRYKTVHFPEKPIPRVTEEQRNLEADHGEFLDQIDDYLDSIFKRLNKMEARFMRERERILNDYYTKGYANLNDYFTKGYAMEVTATPPAAGRRRFRHGVTKQGGKTKMLN